MKIDLTKFSKNSLLKLIKDNERLSIFFIECDYFEDFYPFIFESFEFTDEQLQEVKYDFIKRRL